MTLEEADAVLERLGLAAFPLYADLQPLCPNDGLSTISTQQPAAGSRAQRNTRVEVHFNRFQRHGGVLVPDVMGMEHTAAIALIERWGLHADWDQTHDPAEGTPPSPDVSNDENTVVPPAHVTAQSPASCMVAERGSYVTLTTAIGDR